MSKAEACEVCHQKVGSTRVRVFYVNSEAQVHLFCRKHAEGCEEPSLWFWGDVWKEIKSIEVLTRQAYKAEKSAAALEEGL